jgi:hypothetical protein
MGSSVRTGSSALAEVLMSARIAGSVCYYTAMGRSSYGDSSTLTGGLVDALSPMLARIAGLV